MSTIDSYKQHFSNDAVLWIVPDRIQQTGAQVSERSTSSHEAAFTDQEEPQRFQGLLTGSRGPLLTLSCSLKVIHGESALVETGWFRSLNCTWRLMNKSQEAWKGLERPGKVALKQLLPSCSAEAAT